MRIERVWAMPNRWTFTIKPIKRLIQEEMADSRFWLDPFAGRHSPANYRNDINPNTDAEFHMDAIEFLEMLIRGKGEVAFVGAFFDPPYSPRQFKECYDMLKLKAPIEVFNAGYLARCRDLIAHLIEVRGKVISFGWNSNGIGKSRGFEIERVLLVAHGSGHNDTIVTVERKTQTTLNEMMR